LKVEFLHIADQYYVLATSDLAGRDTRVLKQGETFAIFDVNGDIQPVIHAQSGIFNYGTRFVSRFEFHLAGQRPLLLHSTLRDDNGTLIVDMTNRDLYVGESGSIPKGTIHIHREKFLSDSRCYEQITLTNFGPKEVETDVTIHFACDFADIFEVRGTKREKHGTMQSFKRNGHFVIAPYQGLDGVERATQMYFSGKDFEFSGGVLSQHVKIPSQDKVVLQLILSFRGDETKETGPTYDQALEKIRQEHAAGRSAYCGVHTSNDEFNGWMRRSTDDLVMMTTKMENGELYPYAGIPWFCCPFGRDGLITALETLWSNPSLSKGVLEYLAETQADKNEPKRDANPGKILHEAREGEMANLGEIPFGRYYGSIDSTSLFLSLGGLYLTRTNDTKTIQKLWPNFQRAMKWMDEFGDPDGDGFIEYQRESKDGLQNQGWKDSHDSVFHQDGSDAKGPIALAEVQGYAYLAWLEGSKLATAAGDHTVAGECLIKANKLKENFDEKFWLEELGTFALALDGEKKPCRVKSSNAGQCLFTGIVKPERAERLVKTLMAPDSFSGWGIRTVACDSARYNPMSYHNGSIWPHDVALIAWGMSLYGFKKEAIKVCEALFKSASYMELERIPEVFCGFPLRKGEAPTLYPTACSPQAWSAASAYMMVQSLLGLSIRAKEKRIHFERPCLPDSIDVLKITGLQVGDAKIDLIVQNYKDDVSVQISDRHTGITVTVEK
jgi:glycogen debranching enzyme